MMLLQLDENDNCYCFFFWSNFWSGLVQKQELLEIAKQDFTA